MPHLKLILLMLIVTGSATANPFDLNIPKPDLSDRLNFSILPGLPRIFNLTFPEWLGPEYKPPSGLPKDLEELLKGRPFLRKGEKPTSITIATPSNGMIRSMSVLNKGHCNCVPVARSRIVGGRTSSVSYPWMVQLDLSGGSCGGFIINTRQVVTAAHCTEGRVPRQVIVFAGINDLNARSTANAYRVQYIDESPLYYRSGRQTAEAGDFAVLTIEPSKPFDFNNPNLKPACIDSVIRDSYYKTMATGWGITDTPINYQPSGERANNPQMPNLLKEADFEYMKPSRAAETDQYQCRFNHLVCLKPITQGDSVCSGDSGGPLHAYLGSRLSVIGVAGFVSVRNVIYNGRQASQACFGPSYYARVPYYRNYLEQTTGSHNLCLIDSQNNLF